MLALGIASLMVARSVSGQVPSLADGDARFAALCQKYVGPTVPAVWISISQGGRRIATACAGYRNLEASEPATLNDRVGYGSITKVFTAAMIGSLVASGKLSYETHATDYLPDLASRFGQDKASITLGMLCDHTSCLPRAVSEPRGRIANGTEYRRAYATESIDATLLAAPGSKTEYSNCGITLAAYIAERVTGQTWESLLSDRVLRPLGLSSIEQHPLSEVPTVKGYKLVTAADGSSRLVDASPDRHILRHTYGPAGSLRGTSTDLMRFGEAFLNPGRFAPIADLREVYDAATRALPGHTFTRSALIVTTGYRTKARRVPEYAIRMNGNLDAGRYRAYSTIRIYPESGTVIAIQMNCASADTDHIMTLAMQDAYRLIN